MDRDTRRKLDECNRMASDFIQLYYQAFDKRRHQMGRLYLDNAVFVWNGNGISGQENIQKFFVDLPATEHVISTLDAQPIIDDAVAGQRTYVVHSAGTIKFPKRSLKRFQQSFVITAQDDKWKIVTDSYRIQDALWTQTTH